MRPTFTVVFHPCLSPLASADFSRYARNMSRSELAHLELLAEVDALVERLNRWADDAPAGSRPKNAGRWSGGWPSGPASLRVRIEAPLVVATLGGTGTGKSAWSTPSSGPKSCRPAARVPPPPGRRWSAGPA